MQYFAMFLKEEKIKLRAYSFSLSQKMLPENNTSIQEAIRRKPKMNRTEERKINVADRELCDHDDLNYITQHGCLWPNVSSHHC